MRIDKKRLWFLTIPLFYLPFVLLSFYGCGSAGPDVKNRVPTMPQYVNQAVQSAKDAQAAADQAQKAQKDIQDAINKLNGGQRDSDGKLKEDRPQQTGLGVVSDFGNDRIPADESLGATNDYYLSFTFSERSGFTKRFFPVCPSQSIQAYKPVILMYHWQHFQGDEVGKRGCYIIDGQQAQ